jgi:hypothetical protein
VSEGVSVQVVKLLLRLIRTPASFLHGRAPRRLEMPIPFALHASPLFSCCFGAAVAPADSDGSGRFRTQAVLRFVAVSLLSVHSAAEGAADLLAGGIAAAIRRAGGSKRTDTARSGLAWIDAQSFAAWMELLFRLICFELRKIDWESPADARADLTPLEALQSCCSLFDSLLVDIPRSAPRDVLALLATTLATEGARAIGSLRVHIELMVEWRAHANVQLEAIVPAMGQASQLLLKLERMVASLQESVRSNASAESARRSTPAKLLLR